MHLSVIINSMLIDSLSAELRLNYVYDPAVLRLNSGCTSIALAAEHVYFVSDDLLSTRSKLCVNFASR